MGIEERRRLRGRTRPSVENQARFEQVLTRYAGRLTGVYRKTSLRTLRREWR